MALAAARSSLPGSGPRPTLGPSPPRPRPGNGEGPAERVPSALLHDPTLCPTLPDQPSAVGRAPAGRTRKGRRTAAPVVEKGRPVSEGTRRHRRARSGIAGTRSCRPRARRKGGFGHGGARARQSPSRPHRPGPARTRPGRGPEDRPRRAIRRRRRSRREPTGPTPRARVRHRHRPLPGLQRTAPPARLHRGPTHRRRDPDSPRAQQACTRVARRVPPSAARARSATVNIATALRLRFQALFLFPPCDAPDTASASLVHLCAASVTEHARLEPIGRLAPTPPSPSSPSIG